MTKGWVIKGIKESGDGGRGGICIYISDITRHRANPIAVDFCFDNTWDNFASKEN